MEEILASIRRIIADDGDQPADTLDVPEPQSRPAPEPSYTATSPDIAFAPEPAPSPDDILELSRPLPDTHTRPGLVSEETAAVASQQLSSLSSLVVRNYEGAENTLEGLVREMLMPHLRGWLDTHLPEIVEKMVAKEIARITGRGD